jgi:N-acetylglucosaminyl-diphospho-decaprenol L-rhamnosyltransferase
MGSTVTIEICIVAFGSERYIDSWLAAAEQLSATLAVADNHPTGSTTNAIRHRTQSNEIRVSVRTISLPNNPGFGSACNVLAQTSKADWLVFLNPDATIDLFPPDVFSTNTIIGATQQTPQHSPIHCSGRSYRVQDEVRRSWLRKMPLRPDGHGYVSGGAFAIGRVEFGRLGGFDEEFFLFYEDIDLCLRAYECGIRVVQHPNWVVTHEIGHAVRQNWSLALTASYESGRYFHQKHHHSVPLFDGYVVLDSVARCLFATVKRDVPKRVAYASLAILSLQNLVFRIRPSIRRPVQS